MKLPNQMLLIAAFGLLAACQTTQPNRFNQTDANHDGRLSRDEMSDKLVTDVFTSRDTNKDGKLTKAEWLVEGDAAGIKMFRERDANHDGVVTIDEAKTYGRKHGVANAVLKDADKNHDGSVDREEARAYYGSKE